MINWSMVAAIVGLVGLFVTIISGAVLYGKLVGKVEEHSGKFIAVDGRVERIEARVSRHDQMLNHHAELIGRLRGDER